MREPHPLLMVIDDPLPPTTEAPSADAGNNGERVVRFSTDPAGEVTSYAELELRTIATMIHDNEVQRANDAPRKNREALDRLRREARKWRPSRRRG